MSNHREHFETGFASGGFDLNQHEMMERGATDSTYAMKTQGRDPSSIHFGFGAQKTRKPGASKLAGSVRNAVAKIPSKAQRANKKAAKRATRG